MALPVVSDSIQAYLVEVNRYPVLSSEEEFKVAERYCKNGTIEDAHTLVVSNLRYVVKIALEFRNYGCRIADLIQEGNIGLMTAVKKFNPFKGFRLITYATWWIRSFIQDYILRTKGLVRRGTKALKKKLFYRNEPALAGTNEDADAIAHTDAAEMVSDISLDSPLGDDRTTRLEMLRDERPEPVEAIAEKQDSAIVKKEVSTALALLNDKERMVIEKRVMAEEPESLQGLGDKLGVTRERVRQIESQALKKLQKTLGNIKDAGLVLYPA